MSNLHCDPIITSYSHLSSSGKSRLNAHKGGGSLVLVGCAYVHTIRSLLLPLTVPIKAFEAFWGLPSWGEPEQFVIQWVEAVSNTP